MKLQIDYMYMIERMMNVSAGMNHAVNLACNAVEEFIGSATEEKKIR